MKKLYFGSNLKMYKTIDQTSQYLEKLMDLTRDFSSEDVELFIIPSFTALDAASKILKDSNISLGAQNMHWMDEGQFTGEISPVMLKEIDIKIIEIGHSERRHVFNEKDDDLNKKVLAAVQNDFTALLCIGETEDEKEAGIADETLRIQLKKGLKGIETHQLSKIMVAYEPVWAIGVSGKPASSEYANEKHAVIHQTLFELFGENQIPILYGGSVNAQNAESLICQRYIDGLFVGRAVWEADSFYAILKQVYPLWKAKKEEYLHA